MENPGLQLFWLFILALPVAVLSWTVTHEEVFREVQEFAKRRRSQARTTFARKLFYLVSCEFCFSHYVSLFFVLLTRFMLLLPDWRGYVIAWLSVVWVANLYMSLYARLRLDVKLERIEIEREQSGMTRKKAA